MSVQPSKIIVAVLSVFVLVAGLNAQGGLGGVGGGDLENQIFDAVDQNGGVGGGDTGTTNDFGDFGGGGGDGEGGLDLQDFNFGNFDDQGGAGQNPRDSAFIGVSLGNIPEAFGEFRHVGSVQSAFGGGGAVGGRGDGALGTVGRGGGAGGFGGGAGGSETGFEIMRQPANASIPLRSRIVPRFSSRPMAPAFVSNQVNQRFNPTSLRQSGYNANVTVQGRTAFVSGTAPNQQQARILGRRLRFEPGISRVNNQIRFR